VNDSRTPVEVASVTTSLRPGRSRYRAPTSARIARATAFGSIFDAVEEA